MTVPSSGVIPFTVGAVIPAAGAGRRFGETKQFRMLGKRPLLFHALRPFLEVEYIHEVVVVVPQERVVQIERELRSLTRAKTMRVVSGGPKRQDSVYRGIEALSPECNLVCIHDAARPFLTSAMIRDTVAACQDFDGAIVAMPAQDTVKQVDLINHKIKTTLSRETIWLAQTPQTFHRGLLEKALQHAYQSDLTGTDEAMLMEQLGYSITIIEGSLANVKITTPEDWDLARCYYRQHLSPTQVVLGEG